MTTMPRTADSFYADSTESMRGGPEASSRSGRASVPVSDGARPPCAARLDIDWVPARELDQVPDDARRVCQACPTRSACLLAALTLRSTGYWAGTNRAQRRGLDHVAVDLLPGYLRALDAAAEARPTPAAAVEVALHEAEAGGFRWYRRGCRCSQCRAANSAERARERARAHEQTRIAA